ncbi:hypothetical protein B586_05190 [Mycobacterium haemophilum DSM 44634]|nr:hypothetical protein B586_05190 [Mycobacterium haemophilum DSM 44634]
MIFVEEGLQFLYGRRPGHLDNRREGLFGVADQPCGEGFDHRWFGVKVLVESAFGDLQVENVLNRQTLIADGQDQLLRRIKDLITPRSVLSNVDCSRHQPSLLD